MKSCGQVMPCYRSDSGLFAIPLCMDENAIWSDIVRDMAVYEFAVFENDYGVRAMVEGIDFKLWS